MTRKLKVFLCHASQDKPVVRELYKHLAAESWIEPWLDEENLLPGMNWDTEIKRVIRGSDVIIICMSKLSVEKEGYLNKEIRRVLDISDEKLEGAIYIIPLRLDDCNPSFERLKQIHYADYFTPNAHERLLKSLRLRADTLKIEMNETKVEAAPETKPSSSNNVDPDLYKFIQIPATEDVPYSFYIGKYPVTNLQYERFVRSNDFSNPIYWLEFSKFTFTCERNGDWGKEGLNWLQYQLRGSESSSLLPSGWSGNSDLFHPVTGVSWFEASAYCEWLFKNWIYLDESSVNSSIKHRVIRLPLENEWIAAAGGDKPRQRYPWDVNDKVTATLKDVLLRSNVENGIGRTTPVNNYSFGVSQYGVADMAGNTWEWQANLFDNPFFGMRILALRGGSWLDNASKACVSSRESCYPYQRLNKIGFRVVVLSEQ